MTDRRRSDEHHQHHQYSRRSDATGSQAKCCGPAQPGYEEARRVFNGMIDRRPALIARCTSTADVAAAVSAAREHGLVVAVRGGGHSFSGLVHLRRRHGDRPARAQVDHGGPASTDRAGRRRRAVGRIRRRHPGARAAYPGRPGHHHRARRLHHRGGYGWTSSKYGLACDNLISAEVVLADGSVVRASEHEHADLFWGIRGGGGNFGVVTEFEFRLHPLGPIVLAGLAMFPVDRAPRSCAAGATGPTPRPTRCRPAAS